MRPLWATACCVLALMAADPSPVFAQSTGNTEELRGIGASDDGLNGAERRRNERSAENGSDNATGDPLAEPSAGATQTDASEITGTIQPVQAQEPVQIPGTINPRQTTVDNQSNLIDDPEPYDQIGIRIGTFVLRSSVTEQIAHEIDRDGSERTERTYSRTTLNGELQSDWSRHQLTITGEQVIDETLSGNGAEDPSTSVDADLRLDLSSDTTANVTFDYSFGRESQTDANAISNAFSQSDVHEFNTSASLEHLIGSWRGTATLSGGRSTYGDAELGDGSIIRQSDRDEYDYTVTLRAGVDIGANHLPFVEGDFGQILYDQTIDDFGFARSSKTYGLRVGTQFDFGDKLNGEIAVGYAQRDIDDSRLAPIKGVTVDGFSTWSPRRGLEIVSGLTTTLEDSTTENVSGSVYYAGTTEISYQLRENLTTTIDGVLGWRNYSGELGNQTVIGIGAGFIWWLNRRFGIDGDISYEKTLTEGDTDSDDLFVGLGVTLRP
ncbi:MAG: outer membrane beta-barrel protein [Alphaproteobacteria bacterium]|nr:outer membrane beta-barrel protein [Alphaproteobacteria bacterium]